MEIDVKQLIAEAITANTSDGDDLIIESTSDCDDTQQLTLQEGDTMEFPDEITQLFENASTSAIAAGLGGLTLRKRVSSLSEGIDWDNIGDKIADKAEHIGGVAKKLGKKAVEKVQDNPGVAGAALAGTAGAVGVGSYLASKRKK